MEIPVTKAPSLSIDGSLEHLSEYQQTLVKELSQIRSSRELAAHPTFKAERKILKNLLGSWSYYPSQVAPEIQPQTFLRVGAWNVERGNVYEGILETLQKHPQLSDCEVLILSEVDFGMARSGNRHVARELGEALQMHTVFAPAYLNLDKGNGAEAAAEGNNKVGLQGHAILSRYPLHHVELIPLPNTKDHMAGVERQIGQEQAIVATVQGPQPIDVVCVHLAAHSSRKHRRAQMGAVLRGLRHRQHPILIGGDWNTTTYNAHKTWRAILGFWRRVAMGVDYVSKNHYPYPERYFERKLFADLEAEGFSTQSFNLPGQCTFHYDFHEGDANAMLSDWIPHWCFYFINWALKPLQGKCGFKIDWFAGRNLKGLNPRVIQNLPRGQERLSDHDPILVDIPWT